MANLPVVSAGEGLVAKEVDGFEALVGHMTETESFVPARGEDVEGDLAACS